MITLSILFSWVSIKYHNTQDTVIADIVILEMQMDNVGKSLTAMN